MEKSVIAMALEELATPVLPSPQATLPEDSGVASKDVILDHNLDLWVRLFLPPIQSHHNESKRMPVCLYFHGGAFIMGSPAWRSFHMLCVRMAAAAGAIVVSVNYRLAPKHRLPAAYDDCLTALSWLRSEATKTDNDNGRDGDPWLQSHADFSRVFIVGDSAGGNIVHHVIVKGSDWNPLKIKGAVMVQPSFGGEQRTQSEIESPEELEQSVRNRMMALPEGADKDHPFCNPLAASSDYPTLAEATLPPLLIVIGGRDMLRDRAKAYYESVVKHGKAAELIAFEEEKHGFYILKQEAECTETLIQHIARFVDKSPRSQCLQPAYRGVTDVFAKVYRESGLRGLYRGVGPTLLGILPYAGLKFYIYEELKSHVPVEHQTSVVMKLACGALAGLLGQTFTYPLDTVKRQMQVQSISVGQSHLSSLQLAEPKFRGTLEGLSTIIRTQGWKQMFSGLSINYLKIVPSVAIGFAVYDGMKSWLGCPPREKTKIKTST